MEKFLKANSVSNVESMYGKEVYVTYTPDIVGGETIYKGTLLGYGAYGYDPEQKTFCVYIDRGDAFRFVDYFSDGCFRSKKEFEEFKERTKETCDECYTISMLMSIMKHEEKYIKVNVKVGNMVYPVQGIAELAKSVKEPAFVLKADVENGKEWLYE